VHRLTAAPVTDGARLRWLRLLPLLTRPVIATMPWATLLAGCLAGSGYLAVRAHFDGAAHFAGAAPSPLDYGTVRLAFLPAVAALAFAARAPFRPLTQATPVPAWMVPAGHLLLAAPILAVTCWVQLRITAHTIAPHALGHPPAVYPLIAQLTGWCAVTVAVAACAGRSRYADIAGAIAAPVSFAAIALAWYAPLTSRLVTQPPATGHSVAVTWYAVATAAFALTWVAMRDQWHRYSRGLRRLPPPGRAR